MIDYKELIKVAEAAKAAYPGEPWHYQEESDAYTHIVRVDNPALNNSLIVTQLTQRNDGVSEAVARHIAATNPHVILAILAECTALQSQLKDCRKDLFEHQQAYQRLNDHKNECERQLDGASALLVEIAKSGHAYRECTDRSSATCVRISAISEYVSQFQPETPPQASDETDGLDQCMMNPCKKGHRDVGAAGGVAHCYQCQEKVTAATTQEAFDQWNATHPAVHV